MSRHRDPDARHFGPGDRGPVGVQTQAESRTLLR